MKCNNIDMTVRRVPGTALVNDATGDVIFEQPYCRISNLEAAGIAKRQTASKYLKVLVGLGVLEEHQAGREKIFIHPKLMRLLTTEDDEFNPYE